MGGYSFALVFIYFCDFNLILVLSFLLFDFFFHRKRECLVLCFFCVSFYMGSLVLSSECTNIPPRSLFLEILMISLIGFFSKAAQVSPRLWVRV